MMSFRGKRLEAVQPPLSLFWLVEALGESKGRQEVYKRQSPQILEALRELALVESAESSNRIEGVTVERQRLRPLVLGDARPRDRSEEEIVGYRKALSWVHALVLDFLCIHPFRDGNGRVSRLLTLLVLYHHGYEVGRYHSLERLVEQTKESYYDALARSSGGWHEARHDVLPWFAYFLATLRAAYREFEERAGRARPTGSKADLVAYALEAVPSPFGIADLERPCPNVSREMIRVVMNRWRREGRLEIVRRGRDARYRVVHKATS